MRHINLNLIPVVEGVLMPLVVFIIVTVEVEGPSMTNVEKSSLEQQAANGVYQVGRHLMLPQNILH